MCIYIKISTSKILCQNIQRYMHIHVYMCGCVYMNACEGVYESIEGKEVQMIRHME